MLTMSTKPRSKKGRFITKKQQAKVNLFIANNVGGVREDVDSSDFVGDCRSNETVSQDQGESPSVICSTDTESETENENSQHITWRDGRRVVELDVLVDELKGGCRFCDEPISLVDLTSELRYGLGSLLSIKCSKGHINLIPTGKRHFRSRSNSAKAREQAWEINDKLAFGKLPL